MFTLLGMKQHYVLILEQALNMPVYLYSTACKDAYALGRVEVCQFSDPPLLINLIARFVRPRPVIFAEHYSASDRCALESPAQLFMRRFCVRPEIAAVPILAALFVFLQYFISVNARTLPCAILPPRYSIPERRYYLLSNVY